LRWLVAAHLDGVLFQLFLLALALLQLLLCSSQPALQAVDLTLQGAHHNMTLCGLRLEGSALSCSSSGSLGQTNHLSL
jgi:hypothetical protein